jgi:Zn-dependent protease with chaperone function
MTYHTLAQILTSAAIQKLGTWAALVQIVAGPTLLAWSRRSEVTADRAGLLCCGDIAVAERALLRLLTGLADVDRVDMEDYLRRYKDIEDFHGSAKFQELFSTHPMLPKRILALRLFANSEIYYSLSGKPKPEGQRLLSREELNRRVSEIVKP